MERNRPLGQFLQEVIEWGYEDFSRAEKDPEYTTNQGLVFSLIRACVMEKLPAIVTAISRLDGKLVTPVQIIYPKVFFLYPHATPTTQQQEALPTHSARSSPSTPSESLPTAPEGDILPTLSLRETVQRMGSYPRSVPPAIIEAARAVDQHVVDDRNPMPPEVPRVKSVVAAHLLQMGHSGNLAAVEEIFDQIDGKLTETIKLVGEDIYLTSFAATAPPGAILNQDGVLQLEAPNVQQIWQQELSKEVR